MPIYKEIGEQAGAKIEEDQSYDFQLNGRLDSRKEFEDKDPLKMTSRQISKFSEDDVMAGSRALTSSGRWISSRC